jgi:exosome complex RNA-binding protein Csl4
MSTPQSGEYVIIGQDLAEVEEFVRLDDSTYIKNERIIAAASGFVRIDPSNRTIFIQAHTEENRRQPKRGDVVIGVVEAIRKNTVGVKIFKLNDIMTSGMGHTGNVHVSQVSKKYINNLSDAFQVSDIIRATVVGKMGGEFELSTNTPNTGVIRSDCKYCGNMFVRKNRDQLVCPFCENVERRVLAPDYGMVNEIIKKF